MIIRGRLNTDQGGSSGWEIKKQYLIGFENQLQVTEFLEATEKGNDQVSLFAEVNNDTVEMELLYEFEEIPVVSVELSPEDVQSLKKDPSIAYVEEDVEVKIANQTTPWGIEIRKYQTKNVMIAIATTIGTKIPDTLSATLCISALLPCASSTTLIICDKAVSLPTFVAPGDGVAVKPAFNNENVKIPLIPPAIAAIMRAGFIRMYGK